MSQIKIRKKRYKVVVLQILKNTSRKKMEWKETMLEKIKLKPEQN